MNQFEALQILGLTGQVSKADIKRAYQQKAKEYHPDRNPAGNEIMKMINIAYELVKDKDNIEVFADANLSEYPQTLAIALTAIKGCGLTIEICGLWIWVSGDTRPHKEILKAAGYFWSHRKKMWYYRPADAKSKKRFSSSKEEWSMEQIRERFGVVKPKHAHTPSSLSLPRD